MSKAAVIFERGAPDVFCYEDRPVGELGARGSLFVTRPAIMHYMAERKDVLTAAAELFDVVGSGAVKIAVNHTYPLREVGEAHRAIVERRTTGSTVLLP